MGGRSTYAIRTATAKRTGFPTRRTASTRPSRQSRTLGRSRSCPRVPYDRGDPVPSPRRIALPARSAVARKEKTLEHVLGGRGDANIGFDDLRNLLIDLDFRERTRGSHHIFRRMGIEEMINLQREGAKAKHYQVRQVRAVILKYRLQE